MTPSFTIALTSAPDPFPVLSMIVIFVLTSSYPLPPFTTVIAEIVPEADTVAVSAAATGFTSFTILTPMLFITKAELSSS